VGRKRVNLSEAQWEAMLQLGNTASGHDFIPAEVLEELLALALVYSRASDNLDFTPAGERVYHEPGTE
jgi:hypothetical protein